MQYLSDRSVRVGRLSFEPDTIIAVLVVLEVVSGFSTLLETRMINIDLVKSRSGKSILDERSVIRRK